MKMTLNKKYNQYIYHRIEKLNTEISKQLINKVEEDSKYYPSFHIAPAYGLLNDPNGLVYYNGEYHIFYQHCPNGPVHGMKSWHHLTTTDFITYKDHGFPLTAKYDFDNYGVYSGGAYVDGDNLVLLYTGNERKVDEDYKRYPNQCYAIMDRDYQVIKRDVFLKPDFNTHTEHFRDPVKYNQDIIVGAEDVNGYAQIAIYNMDTKTTEYLNNTLDTNEAYMYECPNVVELNGIELLMYSPQGLPQAENNNIYEVVYSVGKVGDVANRSWINSKTSKVDYGFDFYAPQVFQHDKRTILIGWLGQASTDYPLDEKNGWSQMLTIARELKVIDGHLYQRPLEEYDKLTISRTNIESGYNLESRAFKLDFETTSDFELKIGNGDRYIRLSKDSTNIVFDRTNCDYQISEEYGTTRTIEVENEGVDFQIYVDHSAIEIFINDGQYVMTSRFLIENIDDIDFEGLDDIELSYLKAIEYKEK